MLLYRFAKVIAILWGLIGKGLYIAPRTRTFHETSGNPGSGYLKVDHGLHRRENTRLTSGTITITVAPDPTCGFDARHDSVTCPISKRCSWESGQINNVFCDLRYIKTTCLDSTDALDPDKCDLDCVEDINTLRCVESSLPYCLPVEFSGSISDWLCHSTPSYLIIFSTQDMKPRDFTTVVLVDGSPITSWTNAATVGTSATSTIGTITVTKAASETAPPEPPRSGVNVGAIIGGVIGGVAFVSLVVIGVVLFWRRSEKADANANDSLPEHATQSIMPDAKSMGGSTTITQPYSPTLVSPVEPPNSGMPPQVFYQHPQPYGIASPGHQSMHAHELAGWSGDHQSEYPPGAK